MADQFKMTRMAFNELVASFSNKLMASDGVDHKSASLGIIAGAIDVLAKAVVSIDIDNTDLHDAILRDFEHRVKHLRGVPEGYDG